VDRVHFTIHLYRGNRASPRPAAGDDSVPDFSHAIIVEVVRVRGSTLSFHRHCRAVLGAAKCRVSGKESPIARSSPLEFERLVSDRPTKRVKRSTSPAQAVVAMEHNLALLKKDRICAQRLGMEGLVILTDVHASGEDLALYCSMAVVGAPIMGDLGAEDACLEDLHGYWIQLIQNRVLPSEVEEDGVVDASFASSVSPSGSSTPPSVAASSSSSTPDAHHGGMLRSMALRVLANALTILQEKQSSLLRGVLKGSRLVSRPFLQSLAEDLLGAQRLPAVVSGTRLASAHEAALATRCLRILAQHSSTAQKLLVNPKRTVHPTLETLWKNRSVPQHPVLSNESETAYSALSQDIRTC